mmetsp:Transcript_21110/g.43200  ORF Transcript_21110/g.43200 Transcript_21110/m.43200 type:complete len:391 (-) Transcript_21110:2265-3437(-)
MMLPPLPSQSAAPYYPCPAFNALSPVALLYSAVAQLAFLVLKPTPLRLQIREATTTRSSTIPPNKTRKVCIVTGSNTGIGFETSKALVERGYEVVLACRSRDKAVKAVESINTCAGSSNTGGANRSTTCSTSSSQCGGRAVFLHPLDLSSFESVRSFAKAIQERYDSIDVLVNNAGLNTSGNSENNLDLCFQANHLGHFLLTSELMDALLRDGGGRVINLSSVMHHYADGDGSPHSYDYWKRVAQYDDSRKHSAYTPSKLAALLFTLELNRRYGDKGLQSIAVNPGAVSSDIWRNTPRWLVAIFKLVYLTCRQGSTTSVAAATCDFPKDVTYLQPYWLPSFMKVAFPPMEMLGPYVGYRVTEPRFPADGEGGLVTARHLWEASEELASCR